MARSKAQGPSLSLRRSGWDPRHWDGSHRWYRSRWRGQSPFVPRIITVIFGASAVVSRPSRWSRCCCSSLRPLAPSNNCISPGCQYSPHLGLDPVRLVHPPRRLALVPVSPSPMSRPLPFPSSPIASSLVLWSALGSLVLLSRHPPSFPPPPSDPLQPLPLPTRVVVDSRSPHVDTRQAGSPRRRCVWAGAPPEGPLPARPDLGPQPHLV